MNKLTLIISFLFLALLMAFNMGKDTATMRNPFYSVFRGKEMTGLVTDSSFVVNMIPMFDGNVFIKYGASPESMVFATVPESVIGGVPFEIVIGRLRPDNRYYYQVAFIPYGGIYSYGTVRLVQTQRAPGSDFSFAVMADSHIHLAPEVAGMAELYDTTLKNIYDGHPDFLISLGDFALMDGFLSIFPTDEEVLERYLEQRDHVDNICHSIPFYLTLGNHEGENAWNNDGPTSLPIKATRARKKVIPNPIPNRFYRGNGECLPEFGLREDYYSWTWGDALFVVISPYWYTLEKPGDVEDGWAWTLGETQYNWLHEQVSQSTAKWKFVFTHHLTSTNLADLDHPWYGRGGKEVAHLFEWGGENPAGGGYGFDTRRPGWLHGPIHDFLVNNGVTIVFHGHDHLYAKQDLDGIVYQCCPMPSNVKYNWQFKDTGGYLSGTLVKNSGHIEVTVDQGEVNVQYIRSFLPDDGLNGAIGDSYSIVDR